MPLTEEEKLRLRKATAQEFNTAPNPFSDTKALQNGTVVDWVGGFLRSGVENTTELFGVPKSASNVAWEDENPASALAASFLGVGGVYGGFFKATKNIKRVDDGLNAIKAMSKGPVAGSAVREAVRFAPLEAARIVGTAIGSPERLEETLFESAVGLGLAGGIGALSGLPEKFGTVKSQLKQLMPNVNDADPTTLKLRDFRKLLDENKIPLTQISTAKNLESRLDLAVRAEVPTTPKNHPATGPKIKYVTELEPPTPGVKLSKTGFINSMFSPQKNGLFSSQLLAPAGEVRADVAKHAVGSLEKIQEVMGQLPAKATSYMQYPRLLTVNSEKQKAIQLWQNNWSRFFTPWEPGSYMGREADDGMFIMMKKLKGDPAGVNKGDEFLVFKTDRPDLFGGKAAQWTDRQVEKAMWWPRQFPQAAKPLPGSTHAHIRSEFERMSLSAVDDLTKEASPKTLVERVLAGFGVKPGEQLTSSMTAAADFMREYMAPTMHLFASNGPGWQRARRAMYIVKQSLDRANSTAEALVYGLPQATRGKPYKDLLLHGAKDLYSLDDKTVAGLIAKLDDVDRAKLAEIASSGNWTKDVLEKAHMDGSVSGNLKGMLDRLETISNELFKETNAIRASVGLPLIKEKPGHFGLTHVWEGDWRVRIRNEHGNTVFMVGAKDRGQAVKHADEVIRRAGKEGTWKYDNSAARTEDVFERGQDYSKEDWMTMLGINTKGKDYGSASAAMEKYVREAYTPKALEKQRGIPGFDLDMSDAALSKRLYQHYRRIQTYNTELALRFELGQDMLKLADENPQALRVLQERWQNALGVQGKFSKLQNETIDKGLSPYMGSNSASQIVATANTIQHNLQLGSFNFMYPAVNMFTFMTTVMPQISFVGSAPLGVLQKYYGSLMGHGADGFARKPVHFLDPMKMVYAGFRRMGGNYNSATTKAAYERAMAEGIFAPRVVEEHIGVDAQLKTRLKDLISGPNGFVKFMQYTSEFLPNKSEQFSRLHAFSTGLAVGEDILNLSDEALYRFAKDFTHNTMFGYNMVDRAKVIQGPIGSFFGLYKNWQMHYIGWMLEYAGEATRGNFAPLLWSQAGVGTIAGIGGTTAYGVADAFSRMATGKSAFDSVHRMFSLSDDNEPDMASDVAFYGLPAFFNLSLQTSASAFGANPGNDAAMLFSFVQAERGAAIGRALGGAIDTWAATGKSPFSDPLVRDQMLKAVAPRSLIRTAQVLENDYIKSMNTGNPLIQGLSPSERFVYGLGFNTPEMDRTYKIADELYRHTEKRKVAVRYYARQMIELQDAKAWPELTELNKRIMLSGVGIDSVIRSAEGMRQRNLQDLAQSRVRKTSPDYLTAYVEEGP